MERTIYLRGNEELALQIALERNERRTDSRYIYTRDHIKQAISELSSENLRYNTRTGVTYLKREWIARPSRKDDVEMYENIPEVIEWEFVSEISNRANYLSKTGRVPAV